MNRDLVADYPAPRIPDGDMQRYLKTFPLRLDDGREGPAIEPQTGTSPFAALIAKDGGDPYLCNATHLFGQKVVTNAHCLRHSKDPNDYFLVYYNKSGQKAFAVVGRFLYVGSTAADDVGVLEIPPWNAAEWDEAGNGIYKTEDIVGAPRSSFRVTLWSYDPINNRPDLSGNFGMIGMVFSPNHCQASRLMPQQTGLGTDGQSRTTINGGDSDPKIHLFYDHCDRPPMNGNSGSLLTLDRDFRQIIGVHHWTESPTADYAKKYISYDVVDTDGMAATYTNQSLPNGMFFGVGTVFEADAKYSDLFRAALAN